jgi:hypothetical protein
MTSTETARPGLVLSMVGGIVLVASAVLLVLGIDALNAITYRKAGDPVVGAYLLIGIGTVAFLAGGALLAGGRRRHASNMNRPRTYADQHADHTLAAEERPTNPHDNKGREYPIGYWG